jgi:hypothetical protein
MTTLTIEPTPHALLRTAMVVGTTMTRRLSVPSQDLLNISGDALRAQLTEQLAAAGELTLHLSGVDGDDAQLDVTFTPAAFTQPDRLSAFEQFPDNPSLGWRVKLGERDLGVYLTPEGQMLARTRELLALLDAASPEAQASLSLTRQDLLGYLTGPFALASLEVDEMTVMDELKLPGFTVTRAKVDVPA